MSAITETTYVACMAKVISLTDRGRKEIELDEVEISGFIALCEKFGETKLMIN